MNESTLKSFNNDELASTVFLNKYALKTPEEELLELTYAESKIRMGDGIMAAEIGGHIPSLEQIREDFRECLDYFIPAGRIIYALGNKYVIKASFSNCYYIPIEDDSIEGIFKAGAEQARIYSYGGGVGLDLSPLRPRGAKVNNSAKTTTGAVSFAPFFSNNTGLIGQHGRRGANIQVIWDWHPDFPEFIQLKAGKDKTHVQFANISVKISDKFMIQLTDAPESDWEMIFTLDNGEKIVRYEKISILWDLLVQSNWNGAEPGVLFWDLITSNFASEFPESKPQGVNPCGEQDLSDYGSCNLGSINLSKFIDNPFTEEAIFNDEKFSRVVKTAVRFLSNINILNIDRQPLEALKENIRSENKIGLGITGFADALIKLNLQYDTDDAIERIDKIMYKFKLETIQASIDLAKERGMCQLLQKYKDALNINIKGKWLNFLDHPYFSDIPQDMKNELLTYGLHNMGLTTIAPSGSISIIERCSSGMEPIFSLSYDRTVHQAGVNGKKTTYKVFHPLVEEYDAIHGKNSHKKNPNFVVASQIDWMMRIKMQATIQKHITDSISSTVNLPKDTTKEVISDIYTQAWKHKLKGITIYRDGSRDNILRESDAEKRQYKVLEDYKMPRKGDAKYWIIQDYEHGKKRKWHMHYSLDPETKLPNSLFVKTNSTETNIFTNDVLDQLYKLARKHIKRAIVKNQEEKNHKENNVDKIARTLGLLLRHRVPIIEIVKSIEIIQPAVTSFMFQVKKILAEYIIDGTITGDKCPECDSLLVFEGGCSICRNCGYSVCG